MMTETYKDLGEITIDSLPWRTDFIARNLRKVEDGGIFFYVNVDPDEFYSDKGDKSVLISRYKIYDLQEGPIQDRRIISDFELGTFDSSLDNIIHLAYIQKDGGKGPLSVSGKSNVFYVRKKTGEVMSLFLSWRERVGHERFCDKKAFTLFTLGTNLATGWEKGTRIFIPTHD